MERLTTEYIGTYAAKGLCTIGRDGSADGYLLCDQMDAAYCNGHGVDGEQECRGCVIQDCIVRLGKYEDAHEKIEKRIRELKAHGNYPHNFMGQMVDDLEWVLKLFEQKNIP